MRATVGFTLDFNLVKAMNEYADAKHLKKSHIVNTAIYEFLKRKGVNVDSWSSEP